MTVLSRVRRSDGGQAALELIGYVVMVVVVAILAVQGVTAVRGASAVQEAARNGARSLSLAESDWRSVVDETLPDWIETESVDGWADRNRAKVEVRGSVRIGLASIALAEIPFTRTAEFPVER